MIKRLKRSLVESYVGALALGLIFAYATTDLVSIFTAPLSYWVTRTEYYSRQSPDPTPLMLSASLPYLVASIALYLVGYLLLRWLYFVPTVDSGAPALNAE
jgi:ABC-type sulfate transport system permease component